MRYLEHKELFCDDETDDYTHLSPLNFARHHFRIKVINIANFEFIDLPTLMILHPNQKFSVPSSAQAQALTEVTRKRHAARVAKKEQAVRKSFREG